jgi:PAS domain S-box-containing protein
MRIAMPTAVVLMATTLFRRTSIAGARRSVAGSFRKVAYLWRPDQRFKAHTATQATAFETYAHSEAFRTSPAGAYERWFITHRHRTAKAEQQPESPFDTGSDRKLLNRFESASGAALAFLPFSILLFDRHGRITEVNRQTENLFGYRRDELYGKTVEILVPNLLTGEVAPHRAQCVAEPSAGADRPTRELFAYRKDGTEFPAEIDLNVTRFNDESAVLAVIVDRTERHELRRNRQELEHLTRVSAMGELAASLAHELNQPLTAILSNVQAAQRFMAAERIDLAEVREILTDIVQDNNRASEVIRRIRALVKKGEVEVAPLDLASMIRDVVLLVHSNAIMRGIRVVQRADAALPLMRGDRVRLQQVILNLLLNAFDAVENGPVHDRVVTVLATLDSAGLVRVAVRDRGPGLSGDTLDKIFKPFFTSKREGLGLGLSISRSIVETHGGRIWAENNADKGATFSLTLPVRDAADAGRARANND